MNEIVFDKFYDDYDDWYTTKIGKFVDDLETEVLFKLLKPKMGMKILDLGCGTGNISFKLANLGCDVIGIDISEKMLAQAKSKTVKGSGSVKFLKMNGKNMEFEDNSFDAVISMTAFEFIYNPKIVYNEMKRVVKPSGNIIIGTIQKDGSWEKLYSSDICKGTAYEKAEFKSKDDLINLDKENVIEVEECLYIAPGLEESIYTLENEKLNMLNDDIGGFLCVKYTKKN